MTTRKGYNFRFDRELFCDNYGDLRDAYEKAESYIFSDDTLEEKALEEVIYPIVKEDLRTEEEPYKEYLEDWDGEYEDTESPLSPLEYLKSLLDGYHIGTVSRIIVD